MARKDRTSKKPAAAPGISSAENPNLLPPLFSFEKMVGGSGYSVECCQDEDRISLLNKLFQLSKVTWLQIMNAHRHGIGTEKIARTAINPSFPPSIGEDVTILALRYFGMKPIVGYRDGRIFYILFIDHNYSVYNHGP